MAATGKSSRSAIRSSWWPGIAAVAFAAYRLVRRPRATAPELVVVVLAAVTYLPWLVLAAGRDVAFMYYLLPTVPWLCLALGLVAKRLAESRRVGHALVPAWAVVVVLLFAFYYPNRSPALLCRLEPARRLP